MDHSNYQSPLEAIAGSTVKLNISTNGSPEGKGGRSTAGFYSRRVSNSTPEAFITSNDEEQNQREAILYKWARGIGHPVETARKNSNERSQKRQASPNMEAKAEQQQAQFTSSDSLYQKSQQDLLMEYQALQKQL